jgi:D-alanine-D-alanine ligase
MNSDSRETVRLRTDLKEGDEEAVRAIVRSSGFFSEEEIDVAVELVEERRAKGDASGYFFVFADDPATGRPLGYACFGPIPATASSHDLYWIAVDERCRGQGLGRKILRAAEQEIAGMGGTRIYVDTSSRPDYAPTRGFYRAAGYAIAADLPDFYRPGDGKLIFVRVLG